MSFITESKKAYKQVKENHVAIAMGNMLDDEGSMILNQLEELERGINMLRAYVGNDYEKQLPAWVQSKVTLATDYISTVGNYLSSKNEKATEESIKESFSLEENTFEKIYQMQQDGKSAEDIAKELKLKPDLVKKVLGESKVISEGLSDAQIAQLKKEYEPLKGKTITTSQYQQLKNILFKLQDGDLEKLQKQNIPFASTGAGSILRVRKGFSHLSKKVTVPGLEGMAEEKIPQDYLDYLRTIVLKNVDFYEVPPKQIIQSWRDEKNKDRFKGKMVDYKEAVDMSKVTKYKMISIKGDQKEITIDREDLEKHLKLGYVIKEPLTEETTFWWHDGKTGYVKAGYDNKELVAWLKKNGYKPEKKEEVEVKEETELKPVPSLEDSAKKHKVDVEVLKKQLEKGIQVEKEHTKDEKTAEKIALAHIDERPDYYDQLAKVEKQPVKESHFAVGQHVIYKPRPGTFTGDKSITQLNPRKAQIIQVTEPQVGAYYKIKISPTLMTYAQPDELELQEAMFDVRLDVDGGVDTRSADSVAKMLKDKGIMAKVEPSERDSKAVTIDTSASKDKVINVLGNIVDEACWTGYKQVGMKKKNGKEVPNCVPEETIKEQRRLYIESIVAVKNKAEKSGMPYSVLKQVYDRGMAAWKGGHRPGATQVQWALARVNSFVTKSSGTWGGADSDLAKKVKGD